jgi:Transcriptional regulators of sugar metabolism
MPTAEDRQNRIVELVSEKGNIQVELLAEMLDVSQMTIRRDLDKLKKEGIIERRHGVAVVKHETTYTEKMVTMMDEKKKLAEACASMVKPGDTVFLDSGTTIYEIAKRIIGIPDLTVITDDIETGFLLHKSGVELMICGGTVQKETGSIFGTFSNQMMSYIHVGIAFMGAMSI